MHELSVTESILKIVLQSAQENDAEEVTDISLTIGALSSIIDDSVQFYWDHISKGTIAQNANYTSTVFWQPSNVAIAVWNINSTKN